ERRCEMKATTRSSGVAVPVSIRFDPENPKAGEEFKIFVRLDEPAPTDLTLLFEKQRFKFKPAPGEFPALRPTGADYFSLDPTAIKIKVGDQQGETKAAVRPNALDADDNTPVVFPDNLVFTYFAPDTQLGTEAYVIGIARIQPPLGSSALTTKDMKPK